MWVYRVCFESYAESCCCVLFGVVGSLGVCLTEISVSWISLRMFLFWWCVILVFMFFVCVVLCQMYAVFSFSILR